jgi:hypothetical protein
VLSRSADLVQESGSFLKFKKEAKFIQEIQVRWTEKMHEMQKKGFQAKDALNMKKDASKLKDLEFLKSQDFPGPFTNSEDVQTYCDMDITENSKQGRLYVEVRYAKATCMSLNMKSLNSFFRLRQNGKKLPSCINADCLIKYLDTSRSVTQVTIPDLQNTLGNLEQSLCDASAQEKDAHAETDIQIGEHVAVFWIEGNDYKWYLGLVDHINEDGIHVSHFIPARRDKTVWGLPDEVDLQTVEEDQLIKRKLCVAYLQTSRIRCSIELDIVHEIEATLKTIIST